MKLYIPTGGDTVKLFDLETYKFEYIPYEYCEIRVASVDGKLTNFKGEIKDVITGDIIFSRWDYVCLKDEIQEMIEFINNERNKKNVDCNDCCVCEKSSN